MKLTAQDFLKSGEEIPIIDVRSPLEYERGHIPGAFNIPLLSNNEREVVGTLYKSKGQDKAFMKALEFTGPKMAGFVKEANKYQKDKKLLVYCWRGGKRSGSMAWLFNTSGIETKILEGGYKAYRNYIHDLFSIPKNIIVLGGFTGSGKTEILKELKEQHQVIDLEALAHHKGSAFGFIGQKPQPTTEQFENNLAIEWMKLNYNEIIFLEDESKMIGSVHLPDEIYSKIRNSSVIFINVPKEDRIKRLIIDYAGFDNSLIKSALDKIIKRLGGQNYNKAISSLEINDYATIANVSLVYYDKAYLYGLNKRDENKIYKMTIENSDPKFAAKMIDSYINNPK